MPRSRASEPAAAGHDRRTENPRLQAWAVSIMNRVPLTGQSMTGELRSCFGRTGCRGRRTPPIHVVLGFCRCGPSRRPGRPDLRGIGSDCRSQPARIGVGFGRKAIRRGGPRQDQDRRAAVRVMETDDHQILNGGNFRLDHGTPLVIMIIPLPSSAGVSGIPGAPGCTSRRGAGARSRSSQASTTIGQNKTSATMRPMSGRRKAAKRLTNIAARTSGTAVSIQVTRR